MSDEHRKVWSSDGGRVREEKPRPERSATGGPPRIARETKGRRGKTVTVIRGLDLAPAALAELAAELKKRCGVGGSASGTEIVIQGDKVDAVTAALAERGITVKRSGG